MSVRPAAGLVDGGGLERVVEFPAVVLAGLVAFAAIDVFAGRLRVLSAVLRNRILSLSGTYR